MPSVGRWERDRERRKNKMKFDTLFLFVGAKQKRFANVCWHLYWCFVSYEISTRAHTQTSGCLLLPVDFPIILRVFYSECQDQHERPWSGWPYHPLGALCPKQIDCDIYRTPVAFGPPTHFRLAPPRFPCAPGQT